MSEWFVLIYAVSLITPYSLISAGITLWHTVDEVHGEIWLHLGVPASLYFAFQAVVLSLSFVPSLWYLLISVRVLDVSVTHLWLNKPGKATAPLLIIDAMILGGLV
jgi:hypothetical protein